MFCLFRWTTVTAMMAAAAIAITDVKVAQFNELLDVGVSVAFEFKFISTL